MVFYIIIFSICLIALAIGTYTDFKWREVPDWLNYSLIFAALGIRLLYTSLTQDYHIMLEGLYGFLAYFIAGLAMWYMGQWGGGDAKMLWGLGALLGWNLKLDSLLITFFINLFLIGAVYGLIWSIGLAIKHRKKFLKQFKEYLSDKRIHIIKIVLFAYIIVMLILFNFTEGYYRMLTSISAVTLYLLFYLFIFAKSVEKCCMLKHYHPNKLTEGDWIAEEIKVDGKIICSPKDNGIEKHQIKKLIDLNVDKVLVKEGIPFVPSFLVAFLVSLILENWWLTVPFLIV